MKKESISPKLATPTSLGAKASSSIAKAINPLVADAFALYVKTKNFHWHLSGPHFRDYHLLFDEQAEQIFAMTDPIAERVRKVGGLTIHSVGEIGRLQHILDNDAEFVSPHSMLTALRDDNKTLLAELRTAHDTCDEHGDVGTTSQLEVWIDETERRLWFLFEAAERDGHE